MFKWQKPVQDPEVAQRIPPGQVLTEKFPVLHFGRVPDYPDLARWDFRVFGDVAQPFTLNWGEFRQLPTARVTLDIHCVTRWSKFDTRWAGVSIDTLLDGVETAAEYVVAECDGGYTTNLPLEDVTGGRAWVVDTYEDEPLAPEHGGPARLLVPHLYFWKSAKWVRGLRLTLVDEPGFWETFGYHNYGDPWREQRYQGD